MQFRLKGLLVMTAIFAVAATWAATIFRTRPQLRSGGAYGFPIIASEAAPLSERFAKLVMQKGYGPADANTRRLVTPEAGLDTIVYMSSDGLIIVVMRRTDSSLKVVLFTYGDPQMDAVTSRDLEKWDADLHLVYSSFMADHTRLRKERSNGAAGE